MSRKVLLACLLALNLASTALPQQAQDRPSVPAAPPQQRAQDDDVVRITTNLVQVDAIVVDKDGRHVTDLRPEDFEVLEDGNPRTITNFSYIDTSPARASSTDAAAEASRGKDAVRTSKSPAPPVATALPKAQVRRVIVLAFDDLGLSAETLRFAQKAARKFIEEQMQPGDMMAVVRTGTGAGALQQLTADKRQLLAAVEALRWNPRGRGGINAIVGNEKTESQKSEEGARRLTTDIDEMKETYHLHKPVDGLIQKTSSIASLDALGRFVQGLRELPGRKSIVVITDEIPIFDRSGQSVLETEMRQLVDLANRSSVTFYGIDPRGQQTLGAEAAEPGLSIGGLDLGTTNTLNAALHGNDPRVGARRTAFSNSQDGLVHLTRETGGFALLNTNDLGKGFDRIMDDHAGYYLLGYRPDEKTFDPKTGRPRYRSLKVNVKRPGLEVRARSGFYGTPERERTAPGKRSREAQLVDALSSPFSSSGVGLRLTALFGNKSEGSFIRSLLHIDTRGLTFKPESDGWQRADIDVLAVLFHADGTVAGRLNKTHTLRARGESLERIFKTGIIYPLNVPVKQAGAYQIRFAVRDAATERVGSASEFVEVPDVKKGKRLALSGVVAAVYEPPTTALAQLAAPDAYEPDSEISLVVRRFRRGARMDFGYLIYNAHTDRNTRLPSLTTQVRLFYEGREIFASSPEAFDAAKQSDLKRLRVNSRLRLGRDLKPGSYLLQVIVTDTLAPERERTVTQWTDFEIIG